MPPNFRLLILVAAWAPDAGEGTRKTFDWYRREVLDRFPLADKIIAFNHGSAAEMHDILLGASNVVATCIVPPEMHIDSDAAPYQAALRLARPILPNYDAVLFVQTKGVSYEFDGFDAVRQEFIAEFFDNPRLFDELSGSGPRFVSHRVHMDCYHHSIRFLDAFAQRVGIDRPTLSFGATYAIYGCTTAALVPLLDLMPPWFLHENIVSWGCNRFFFEGLFPSLIVSLGAELRLIGPCQPHPALNADMSYGFDTPHTNALAAREYQAYRDHGAAYRQVPIPYIHSGPDIATKLNVAFSA
jgi:hypothetical protein